MNLMKHVMRVVNVGIWIATSSPLFMVTSPFIHLLSRVITFVSFALLRRRSNLVTRNYSFIIESNVVTSSKERYLILCKKQIMRYKE